MKTLSTFFTKFSSHIDFVFSGFDRMIFKGYLPISAPDQFTKFVDYVLKIKRCDFLKTIAPEWSDRLVEHAKDCAARAGRPFEFLQGHVDKDAWAKDILNQSSVDEGLVGVLCVMESCPTFKLKTSKDRPTLVSRKVSQRVLYYYFVDRKLGLIHVRLQTWAPFNCQVYANGHEYVARELKKRGVAFEQIDNAFVSLADPVAAQKASDRFAELDWSKTLEHYARRVNPLLQKELVGMSHYWVIDQAEYATDIRFNDQATLTCLFVRLLAFVVLTFGPRKIFEFLGRRWHSRYDGEVHSRFRSEREPGTCIKHFMKRNWLKMYNKFGMLLRVETVINQPGEFKIFRECRHRDGTTTKGMYAMCKGIGNMRHYQSQALACNMRYLDALSAVDDPTPGYNDLEELTEPKKIHGRSYAGFNPAREAEAKLFAAVLAGDHVARGFANKDIRKTVFEGSGWGKSRDRQSAAVGRMLKRLHVRGLLAKIPRTRRWRVTEIGRRILGDDD